MKNILFAGALVLVGCGSSAAKDPVTSNSAAPTDPGGSGKEVADHGSSPIATPPPPKDPPKRERIKMYNSCNKPVRLYFKRNGSDLQTSLNTSTHTEERATDGDEIQLMDDTGRKEIDKITITAQMNEVVIANGCTKFDAK